MTPRELDPAGWAALDRLLDEALDRPPQEREAWLAGLSPDLQPLVPRLRRLLEGAGRPSVRLPSLAATGPRGLPGSDANRPGDLVGPYRLTRLLAEGGMGSVWVAERADGLLQRPVALKLPRGDRLDAGLAERLARERDFLGGLSHPHIARLYDAGVTPEGQPWLALELVEGRPLDEHVREARLDTRARVRLFLQVADAVAHAHAHLVVHRDLKPANVLVDAGGQAHLLDFGIAKLLEHGTAQETALTRLAGRALTPGYASPEQVAGQAVGVATDVYSLGVVLYELLTGARPYRLARGSAAELEEAILQAEVPRPSGAASDPAARRLLRGDLEAIVLTALKKHPEARYPTVDAFAEDLRRWLAGQPVRAQADGAGYRLRRFVGRHRLAVGAAAVVVLAILAGAGAALWQTREALAQQRRAQEVKQFIASLLEQADPYQGTGRAPTVLDLLHRARERIQRELAGRPELQVELLNLVGASLHDLHDVAGADAAIDEAVRLARDHLPPDHDEALRARLHRIEGDGHRGREEGQRLALEALLPRLRARADRLPEELVVALTLRASVAVHQGRCDEAVAAAREGVEVGEARLAPHAPPLMRAILYSSLALRCAGRFGEAIEAGARAVRLAESLAPADGRLPRSIEPRWEYGKALAEGGRPAEGAAQVLEAAAAATEVFGPSSRLSASILASAAGYQVEAGALREGLATAERALQAGDPDAGGGGAPGVRAALGAALVSLRDVAGAVRTLGPAAAARVSAHGVTDARAPAALVDLALALAYAGRTAEAREKLAPVLAEAHPRRSVQIRLPRSVAGRIERLAGNAEAALRHQQAAIQGLGDDPYAPRHRLHALPELGAALVDLGRPGEALPALEEALRLQPALEPGPTPGRADALVALGRARLALGRAAEALAPLEEADAFWQAQDPSGRWAGEAALWLGRCHSALGRPDRAAATLTRAARLLGRSPLAADARLRSLARAR